MSKDRSSRVRFADEAGIDGAPGELTKVRRIDVEDEEEEARDKKHTLDSDEEDEADKYQRLDIRKVEGQEDATDEYDGTQKIMAFNMNEDMEEGHFDNNGTFIFDKKGDVIKDAWLDNVNWDNVKSKAGQLWEKNMEEEEQVESISEEPQLEKIYSRLLELLRGNETIASALKRLNSEKGLTAAEERKRRWAAKKAGTKLEDVSSKESISEITALADSLISSGHMEAYQLNAEQIKKLVEELGKAKKQEDTEETAAGSSYDMFGDTEQSSSQAAKVDNISDGTSETFWEYRLNDDKAEEVHGPLSTTKIMEMSGKNKFENGAVVRRVGTETFYDIERIDFELYE